LGDVEYWDPEDLKNFTNQNNQKIGETDEHDCVSLNYSVNGRSTTESDITGNLSIDTGEYVNIDRMTNTDTGSSRKDTLDSRENRGLTSGPENFGILRRG
jgi:hypothetical protein